MLKLFGHYVQIQANTNASNTAVITAIVLSAGIPSIAGVTPSTGIFGSVDSKTSRSLFGSGNIAIHGLGPERLRPGLPAAYSSVRRLTAALRQLRRSELVSCIIVVR